MKLLVVSKVVVFNEAGQVLLIRRSESDIRRPLEWDVPGGHTENDEYANEGAARELLEETGISYDPRRLRLVYAVSAKVSEDLSVTWTFFVAGVANPVVKLSDEHTEYRWMTLDEAIAGISYERQKTALQYVRDNQLAGER